MKIKKTGVLIEKRIFTSRRNEVYFIINITASHRRLFSKYLLLVNPFQKPKIAFVSFLFD